MKKTLFHFLTAILCLTGLVACENVSIHSPLINMGQPFINSEAVNSVDTLFIGDTLRIDLILNPYYNTITRFTIDLDRAYIKDSVFSRTGSEEGNISDYEKYCDTEKSDYERGIYVMKGLQAGERMLLHVYFIGLHERTPASERVNISMALYSDVDLSSEYNPNVQSFSLLVAQKKSSENNDSESSADNETESSDESGNADKTESSAETDSTESKTE